MTRCLALLLLAAAGFDHSTDWPSYGNDPGAMRYSTLRQIHTGNVDRLTLAWTFRTGKPGSEAIPIVFNGVMYVTVPDGVYALVPETGELLWKYDAAPMALRGLAYWPGSVGVHPRVLAGNGHFLLAVDVVTGKPAPEFGNQGRVDLKKGVLGDLKDGQYELQSPPAVFGDVVITGCSTGEGPPSAGPYGDIRRAGRVIPAVAQITKMGLLFVLDRVTGEPVYGIEERAVPQTEVPGEVTAKTQPFPLKPPPLGKNEFRLEEMYDRSPEHARFCRELFAANQMKIGGPYTPLPLEGNALFYPSTLGGGNWGGVSVDPSLGLLFVNVMHVAQWGHMEKRGSGYVRTSAFGRYARFWNPETHTPCQNPPFGEMIAVDLASGDVAWRSVLGENRRP